MNQRSSSNKETDCCNPSLHWMRFFGAVCLNAVGVVAKVTVIVLTGKDTVHFI